MNRIEFMIRLESLLQDVPEEEREEAIQYYNDYFDDAGEENEAKVISELESPQKVAAKLKAGLDGQEETAGEYTENGYQDSRFEQRETPVRSGYEYRRSDSGDYENGRYERNNRIAKIILIIGIIVVGAPVVIPLVMAAIGVVLALIVSAAAVIVSVVIAAAAVLAAGIVVAVAGFAQIFTSPAAGMLTAGIGLLLAAAGLVGTMLTGWVLLKSVPALFRGAVWICRKPFQKGAV